MTDLDGRLLAAHARSDHRALVGLYAEAAETANDIDRACFFLTHAYVFALEQGHPDAPALRARLVAEGRAEWAASRAPAPTAAGRGARSRAPEAAGPAADPETTG